MVQYPDYDNSIVSVVCSVMKYFTGKAPHGTQKDFDRALERNPKTVIVMLFDGMGTALLERHLPQKAFLRRHLVSTVSSTFPPTTVAATTSAQSALYPLEHGWLGWELYFTEADDNITVFTNTAQKTGRPACKENLAQKYMPYRTVCDVLKENGIKAETVSPFAGFKIRSAADLCRKVKESAEKGSRYMYCYWTNPDHDAHIFGADSLKVKADIRIIDHAVKRLSRKLDDAVIAVIADHGLVNVKWEFLEDYTELTGMLERVPSMESRCRSIFLKNYAEGFREKFNSLLGDKFMLLSREEALEMKLFGDGCAHERAKGFIGDYIAVATSDRALTYKHAGMRLKAHHAGLTADEMNIPLILIDTENDEI